MHKRGDKIRNRGMNYEVADIQFSPDSSIPTIILRRDFDQALFYARVTHVRHFTNLRRIEDRAHSKLDQYDSLSTLSSMDASYRRI